MPHEREGGKMPKKVNWKEVADLVVTITPSMFGIGIDLSALRKALQESPGDLESKAARAAQALHEAAAVVSQLQSSIAAEVERVDSLKKDYEKYKNLASTEGKKARAFIQQVQESLGHGRSRERWIALGINVVAGLVVFVLGVLLSPLVKQLLGARRDWWPQDGTSVPSV